MNFWELKNVRLRLALEKAIKYGNIAAGLATRIIGGRLSIPKLDEVNKIYEKNN